MSEKLEDLKINPEKLLANGYRSFTPHVGKDDSPWYMGSFQKRFDDEHGRMYYINFVLSDKDKDNFYSQHNLPKDTRYTWEANLQLNTLDDLTFNVEILFSEAKTLEDIENFCAKMFRTMDLQYYEYSSSDLSQEVHKDIATQKAVEVVIEKEKNYLNHKLSQITGVDYTTPKAPQKI